MTRNTFDLSSASAQPNAPLTGGGYYNSSAFQATPFIEKIDAVVIDNRAAGSTGIALGTLYVQQFTAANAGGAYYAPSAVANAALPGLSYGVFVGVPAPSGSLQSSSTVIGQSTGQGQITLVQAGTCNALCTTGANAIAVGSLLFADGSGNLTTSSGGGTAPSAGSATPFGTAGAATVSYQVYARGATGLDSAASATISTSTANATLSATNGVHVAATIPAGTKQFVVVRTAGGPSQGVVGIVNVNSGATVADFYDLGQAGEGAYAAPGALTVSNPGSTTPGQVLAIAQGTLAASTATPTLVLVSVGGF